MKPSSILAITGALQGSLDYNTSFMNQQSNGEFHPKQHKVESYRSQQRAAKKRRNIK